ncbi:MAG: hypothetical protein ACI8YQ_004575 [Polaribacter sp.]
MVVAKDDGTLPPFLYSISEQVDYLNSLFTNGMSFYVCDTEIIENSTFFDIDLGGEVSDLYDFHHVDYAINVYFTNTVYDVGGIAGFPWNGSDHGVVIKSNELLRVLPHEIGHFFGVHHTHNGTIWNPSPINLILPDNPGELVDGANAHLGGDRMIDTPADPGVNIPTNTFQVGYCDVTSNCGGNTICYENNTGATPYLDPNTDPYAPDIFNIMGYYNCGNHYFSLKQLELMEKALLYEPNLNYLLNTNPNHCESSFRVTTYCELTEGTPLQNQPINITSSSSGMCTTETNEDGNYGAIQCLGLGYVNGENIDFTVAPKLYDPNLSYHVNQPGMTAYDLWLINQHILQNILLDTPYKRIAADANNDGAITGEDINDIGGVITGKKLFFTWLGQLEGAAWRFVPSFYLNSDATFNSNFFSDPFTAEWTSPTGEVLPYVSSPDDPTGSYMDYFSGNLQNSLFLNNDNWSFRAVKIGDVNCNAPQSPYFNFGSTEPAVLARESGIKINTIENYGNSCLEKGKKGKILFSLSSEEELSSYQLGVSIDNEKIKVNKVQREDDKNFSLDKFNHEDLKYGDLKTIWWNEEGEASSFSKEKILFSLEIEALEDFCDLADLIKVNREVLPSWFYNIDGNPIDANLFVELSSDFMVDRNQDQNLQVEVYPNPSTNQFTFEFKVEKEEEAILTIYDYFGNAIEQKIVLTKGKQAILIDDTSKLSHGLLYYKLSVNNKVAQGKIIKIK